MAKEIKEKIDPFNDGVSYADFLNALGKDKVSDYCKGMLTPEQIEWLENDLEIYKTTK